MNFYKQFALVLIMGYPILYFNTLLVKEEVSVSVISEVFYILLEATYTDL